MNADVNDKKYFTVADRIKEELDRINKELEVLAKPWEECVHLYITLQSNPSTANSEEALQLLEKIEKIQPSIRLLQERAIGLKNALHPLTGSIKTEYSKESAVMLQEFFEEPLHDSDSKKL